MNWLNYFFFSRRTRIPAEVHAPFSRDAWWMVCSAACLLLLPTLSACNRNSSVRQFTVSRLNDVVGGQPVYLLHRALPPDSDRLVFQSVQVLPGRGMNTFQIQAHLPGKGLIDVLASPSVAQAQKLLNGGPDDLHGNQSFWIGGAVLAPFAGRIRGTVAPDGKTVSIDIKGNHVVLPANWSGKRPGAEKHAIHGLILDRQVTEVKAETNAAGASITGVLKAGDFGVGWPSRITITTRVTLAENSIEVRVTALNEGSEGTVVGLGWHPYFAFPSHDRRQVRLRIPAAARLEVNNRDDHFPTGRLLPVEGTAYDLSVPGGGAIAGLSLEDCFTNLKRDHDGHAVAEISDPSAKCGLRVTLISPEISAVQVYAPADKQYVAIEPWFNLPDPFGTVWKTAAGMVELRPGESATYTVQLQLFTPGSGSRSG